MSKNQLADNIVRRIKNVYKSALTEFEKQFPNLVDSKPWSIARFNILTIGNDAIRSTLQELQDKETDNNIFSLKEKNNDIYIKQSVDFINLLNNVIFSKESIIFNAKDIKEEKCLSLLHKELNFSLIDIENGIVKLFICGLDACISNLSVLDYLAWPVNIKKQYIEWRNHVAALYKELGS